MARFALFTNGVKVETLDDLKDNFNIKDMENNFRTKALHRWLAEKGLREELKKIENIPSDSDKLGDLLMECFALSDEQRNTVKERAEDEAKRIQEEQRVQEKHGQRVIDIPMPDDVVFPVWLRAWRVQAGDEIKKGDILCEITSCCFSTKEVKAEFDGTITELLAQEEEKIDSWTAILRLESNLNEVDIGLPWYCTGGIITHVEILFPVHIGDQIKRGDTLFKVDVGQENPVEIKSRFDGIVSEFYVPEGEVFLKPRAPIIKLRIASQNLNGNFNKLN